MRAPREPRPSPASECASTRQRSGERVSKRVPAIATTRRATGGPRASALNDATTGRMSPIERPHPRGRTCARVSRALVCPARMVDALDGTFLRDALLASRCCISLLIARRHGHRVRGSADRRRRAVRPRCDAPHPARRSKLRLFRTRGAAERTPPSAYPRRPTYPGPSRSVSRRATLPATGSHDRATTPITAPQNAVPKRAPRPVELLAMRILLASISVGLAIGCASAPQQPPVPLPPVETTASTTPEAVLQRLFTSERIESGWFAEEFLGQVPFPRVVALVTDLRGALGDWRGVRRVGAVYDVQLASGAVPVRISIDPAGRISALWAASPRPSAALIPAVLARFNELPARARSVLLLEGETERAALNPDLPLAVATSSRLAVIVALREAVTAGTHSWSEVVPLRPAWQSLPTGILQTWPPDAPLTVYTLAALAAAHSDNTAFDALIDLVGRTAVEGFAPHNRPFLTTREVFALKDPLNGALLAQFWAGDEPQRRALLPDLDARALPSPEAVMGSRQCPPPRSGPSPLASCARSCAVPRTSLSCRSIPD